MWLVYRSSSRGASIEAAIRPPTDTDDSSRQTTTTSTTTTTTTTAGAAGGASGPVMSEDELRRKTKSIVDEYLHLNDLKVCSCSCNSTSIIIIHHRQTSVSIISMDVYLHVKSLKVQGHK